METDRVQRLKPLTRMLHAVRVLARAGARRNAGEEALRVVVDEALVALAARLTRVRAVVAEPRVHRQAGALTRHALHEGRVRGAQRLLRAAERLHPVRHRGV